jgi:hypothetical protein
MFTYVFGKSVAFSLTCSVCSPSSNRRRYMIARSAVSLTGILRSLTQLMVGGMSLLRYGSKSYIE